ncbi:MAG: DinB family protein, partial [Actinomycetota bacterium]|nr:DinB family protein [Actinomycetota bacterium]
MTENAARDLLIDAFTRVRELVVELTDGLTEEIATYRPGPQANSIGWLLWHLTRIQDDHVAALARVEQAWPKWRERFGLPFSDWETGYGQTSEEVAAVRPTGHLLAGYHADVHALTLRYLDRITTDELARVVDTHWDPPVTASVRLV